MSRDTQAKPQQSELERAFMFSIKAEKLSIPETEVRFAPPRRWRADFLWPDHKVIAELHGGTWNCGGHVRGKQFESDCEKSNAAQLLGYTYLTFTTDMVHDGRAIATLREVLWPICTECGGHIHPNEMEAHKAKWHG